MPIDSITRQRIKKDYLSGNGSLAKLAKKHGVSLTLIKAWSSEEGWTALKSAQGTIAAGHGVDPGQVRVTVSPEPKEKRKVITIDPDELLATAIDDLAKSLPLARVGNKEGCASALVKLLAAYNERHPQTIEELTDLCVKLGFNSDDFFKALDEKWRRVG